MTNAAPQTSAGPVAASRAVEAPLTFITRQDAKPYFLSSAMTGGDPEVHFKSENHVVAITTRSSARVRRRFTSVISPCSSFAPAMCPPT